MVRHKMKWLSSKKLDKIGLGPWTCKWFSIPGPCTADDKWYVCLCRAFSVPAVFEMSWMVLEGNIGGNKMATSLEIYCFLWSKWVCFTCVHKKAPWGGWDDGGGGTHLYVWSCFEQPLVGRDGGCCSGTSCLGGFSVRKKNDWWWIFHLSSAEKTKNLCLLV